MTVLHHFTPDSWDVNYPDSLMKYIDCFRVKYFKYDKYDSVLSAYIQEHQQSSGVNLCSLGCGTAHHEIELAKHKFIVTGVDQHSESLSLGKKHVEDAGANVTLLECDFTNEGEVQKIFKGFENHFDILVMLLIPLSIEDHGQAFKVFAPYLKRGGIIVTSLFGYESDLPSIARSDAGFETSNVEVADLEDSDDFIVRLNSHRYQNNIIYWDAVYVYADDGKLCMKRDHDILEVTDEGMGKDPLNLGEDYTVMPTKRVSECGPGLTPPFVYEYLIAWRKNGG